MDSHLLPVTKDLVLIGGGHSHALFLRKWGMRPLPGARVTVINPGPTAPYSGMLPGFVAGHYDRSELDIDLVQLARFAGARVILGAADHVDLSERRVYVPGRPPVAYDICSLDIGITSDMPNLAGFAKHGVPAKPLGHFAARWAEFLESTDPAEVVVLGAGVAGVELALAMTHALRVSSRNGSVTLIDSEKALTGIGGKAQMRLLKTLGEAGVTLLENTNVTSVEADHLILSDGSTRAASFVTGAAGARAYDWLGATGLDLENGFVRVNDQLQSSDPAVFAVGDCAQFDPAPRPKAGVYAVRQAPVLYDNLCAALSGGEMRSYRPQRDYLKLISLGDKRALGERFGTTFSGAAAWRLKNRIDQKFMARFRALPAMADPTLPSVHADGLAAALGERPMCGGCGAKIGRDALRQGLESLPKPMREDVIRLPGDDAALLKTGTAMQVVTSDHLRAMTRDPVSMARISAVHALGDIWAMGANPQAALGTIILPRMSPVLQQRTLEEITAAASDVFREAGADIVGGHSSLGEELTIGFTVTGVCEKQPITLSGGKPGDVLILTKRLGSGVIMAAEMAGKARGEWVQNAWAEMTRPQGIAARILNCAHAMTDVTGFGLAGHLHGLCEMSGTGAELSLADIPLLDGAADLARNGWRSTLYDQNRALVPELDASGAAELLFDPQTCGGLLAAVQAEKASGLVARLREEGFNAAAIGMLCDGPVQIRPASA